MRQRQEVQAVLHAGTWLTPEDRMELPVRMILYLPPNSATNTAPDRSSRNAYSATAACSRRRPTLTSSECLAHASVATEIVEVAVLAGDEEAGGDKQLRVLAWRQALDHQAPSPQFRNYLTGLIEEWSEEVEDLCAATLPGSGQSDADEWLRRGACIEHTADLLDRWTDREANFTTKVAEEASAGGARKPARWASGDLGRVCPIRAGEGYAAWMDGRSHDQQALEQGILHVQALMQLGRAREALTTLEALRGSRADRQLPANFHLLVGRARYATGTERSEVVHALHAAEDNAELERDDLALFDARVEQARLAVREHERAASRQSAPLPSMDGEAEERILGRANNVLDRQGPAGDDILRLLLVRADLQVARGDREGAAKLRARAVDLAARSHSPRLRAEVWADHAGHIGGAEAAELYAKAVQVAPNDDEMRGYLNFMAGVHAFESRDVALGVQYMKSAETYNASMFGERSAAVAEVAYNTAQHLYSAGESSAALPLASRAVEIYEGTGHRLQLAFALYLRSAVQIRLRAHSGAVDDADAAVRVLPEGESDQLREYRLSLKVGLVESKVADGAETEALGLATELQMELDRSPNLDVPGARDELHLARARVFMARHWHEQASRELAGVEDPRFLAHDPFKRAEALGLHAQLPGRPRSDSSRTWTQAAAIFETLGSDGATHKDRMLTARQARSR